MRVYINIPRGVPVALFLTIHLKLRSSYSVKIKAFSYAFYMYVSCPRPTQGAFSKGNDGTNIHIFTKPKKNSIKKLRQARKKKGAPGHTSIRYCIYYYYTLKRLIDVVYWHCLVVEDEEHLGAQLLDWGHLDDERVVGVVNDDVHTC